MASLFKPAGPWVSQRGDMFGIRGSAVSQIVKQVKCRQKTDQDVQRDVGLLNSQNKT